MKLTVIVPAYNEEESIALLTERVTGVLDDDSFRNDYEYEILFINDGSRDKTLEAIRETAERYPQVKYISFSRNFGKEAAMFAGINYADGNYAVIIDSDLQHPPELIPQMFAESRKGYDQVIARRNRVGDQKGRTFFSKMYYRLVNSMVDVRLEDGVGDFRILSEKALNALKSMKEYTRFSKGLFSWIGFKSKTIEYENVQREAGETKWNFKSLLSYALDGIMSFNDKPLRITIFFGFTILFLALLYILYSFIRIFMVGIETPGYFTQISAILFMGGVQLISIGILGEYIGKIYYEVKERPHFLIQETNIDKDKSEKDNKSPDGFYEADRIIKSGDNYITEGGGEE